MLVGKGHKGPAVQMKMGLQIAIYICHLLQKATCKQELLQTQQGCAGDIRWQKMCMYVCICAPGVHNYVLKLGCNALEYTV